MEDLKTPVLFGCKTAQRYILNVFLYGSMTKFSGYDRSSLSGTGIVRDAFVAGKQRAVCVLDERHPAHRDLVETMRTIAGGEARHFEAPPPSVPFAMDPEAPLGHRGRHAFRMLHRIATHGGEVSVERLRTEMADVWADSVNSNVAMLKRDGVLTEVGGVVRFAEGVPAAYVRAILKIGELLSRDDARLRIPDRVVSTPAAFCRSADGMPLLFGTDRRARNLMAVAKYGPMYWRDVRPLVGGV